MLIKNSPSTPNSQYKIPVAFFLATLKLPQQRAKSNAKKDIKCCVLLNVKVLGNVFAKWTCANISEAKRKAEITIICIFFFTVNQHGINTNLYFAEVLESRSVTLEVLFAFHSSDDFPYLAFMFLSNIHRSLTRKK